MITSGLITSLRESNSPYRCDGAESSKAHQLRVDTNLFESVYVKYLLLEWRQVVLRILKLVILSEDLQLHHNRVQNVRPDTGACKAVSAD